MEINTISDNPEIIEWSGKRIRVFGSHTDPRFHGKDLAIALGYSNPKKAILTHVSSDNKSSGSGINKDLLLKLGKGEKRAVLINKHGVCSLLSASKMPNKNGLIELLGSMYDLTYDIIARLGKEQEYIGYILTSFDYCNPIRQFKIGSYFIDLYFQVENIAIECDEFDHSKYDQQHESTRQEFITKELGCKFIRFNPDSTNFSIFNVINNIGSAILQHHLRK